MVVVCESCSTRFRIDDARIPAKGRLVRCSQCKATFIAKPESASFEDAVEEVVAEVTDAGGEPLPEPAVDLFEAGGGDLDDPTTRPDPGLDDERWEFDDAPRKPARKSAQGPVLVSPAEPDTQPAAFEEVGDPTDWDLLRDAVEPAAREARFVEPIAPAPAQVAVADASSEPFLHAQPEPFRTAPREQARTLAGYARTALAGTAWLALAGIALLSIAPLLASDTTLRAPAAMPRTFPLSDGEARGVQAGFVENAYGGSLFVIRGDLARPAADRRLGLRVHLVDGAGERVGTPRWAGVAPSSRDLRERTPEALRSDLDASAASAALGGVFAAFFEQIPPDAVRFELALDALPELPAASLPEPTPEASPSAPAAAEPTASSSPSRLPSSG